MELGKIIASLSFSLRRFEREQGLKPSLVKTNAL
ncbi:hypothetical protein ACVWWJ_004046 [Luteibacter sp. HA06]|jgi:hypothetical protein